MKYSILLCSLILFACAPEGDDKNSNPTITADGGAIVVANNDNSFIHVTPADSESADSVDAAIKECCPLFIGLSDDDCIIQNYPTLPDDLCRAEPDEEGNPVARPLRAYTDENGVTHGEWIK